MLRCPKCKETTSQHKCDKTSAGSQRYRCWHCRTKYTPKQKQKGYSNEVRLQAVRMYVDGINYRRIARHLNVSHVSVMNWVKAFVAQLPDAPLPEELHTIELDELFTFIETKKNASTSSQQ